MTGHQRNGMNRLAVRVDGSPKVGYGHLMRVNVLARKFLQHGYDITYLTRTSSAVSKTSPSQVNVYQLSEREVENTLNWLEMYEPGALLTDSYMIDTPYQRKLCESVPILITVTDDTRFTLCSDVNINGNIHATELDYNWIGEKPEMLLGTDYLLIRDEFQRLADEDPPWRDPPEQALITFGGSDVNSVTPDVIYSFDGFELEVNVVIGPGFSNEAEIIKAARKTDANFNLLREPENLPRLMFDADFAVSAVGNTVYELLLTGTPVIGIPQSNNQLPIFEELSSRDAINAIEINSDVSVDEFISSANPQLLKIDKDDITTQVESSISMMMTDSDRRSSIRNRGKSLIDAKGPTRVYHHITKMI